LPIEADIVVQLGEKFRVMGFKGGVVGGDDELGTAMASDGPAARNENEILHCERNL
jgi:hypothetical protein